jgi:hypothetical protein
MNGKVLVYIATVLAPFLLIINQGFGSQREPILFFGIELNQFLNWLVILFFIIVCRNTFKHSYMFLVFCIALIFSKVFNILFPESVLFYGFYKFFLLSITFVGGFIYMNKHFNLIHKQVLFIAFINVIMMILQLSNVGEWTQFLSTESTELFGEKLMYDTLFVPLEQLNYSVIQARPSGFLRSNNILSGFAIFALAIQLSRTKDQSIFSTSILTLMMVLSSARLVYISYLFMFIILIFSGNRFLIKKAMVSFISMIFWIFLYSIFFPGLFDNFWNFDSLTYNLYIRINDIIANIQLSFIQDIFSDLFYFTPQADWDFGVNKGLDGVLSTFSIFIKYLEYFILISLLLIIILYRSRKKFLKLKPEFKYISLFCIINLVLFAAAVIIILDQFYWFTAGFALCSLFYYLPNSYLNRLNIYKN